jgi:hypothetical protein
MKGPTARDADLGKRNSTVIEPLISTTTNKPNAMGRQTQGVDQWTISTRRRSESQQGDVNWPAKPNGMRIQELRPAKDELIIQLKHPIQ